MTQTDSAAIVATDPTVSTATAQRHILPALALLFAASGCSALIYEIIWYQLLQLVIGSTAVSLGVLLATFMGGFENDAGLGIAVDLGGDAFVSGFTASGTSIEGTPFPTQVPLQANSVAGESSNLTSFIAALNTSGSTLLFSTFYGGSFDNAGNLPTDVGTAVALDSNGFVYLAGGTLLSISSMIALKSRWEEHATRLRTAVSEIEDTGVLIKDLSLGLLDFPCQAGDEIVLLCWKLGEPAVAFWHTVEDGFKGRKPIDGRIAGAGRKPS